jgi:chemotaxis receptor (MCP) glutamine deamidase CheD
VQEEITKGAVAISIEATKMSAELLQKAMKKVLAETQRDKAKAAGSRKGKQTLRQLMKQNTGVSNIEITDQNIKAFSSTVKKCGIDFALKKDTSGEVPRYISVNRHFTKIGAVTPVRELRHLLVNQALFVLRHIKLHLNISLSVRRSPPPFL